MSIIKDISLAKSGEDKIVWAERHMNILNHIRKDFIKNQPLEGYKIALSIHLEAKTAALCCVLADGGAEMYITGSNPDSTQDDIAAALVERGQKYSPRKFEVFATNHCGEDEYNENLCRVLEIAPDFIVDDGGDLVYLIHEKYPELAERVIGSCEETTTGILRLKELAKNGKLKFPAMNVNDADCKHLFDNHHGTGQSVIEGIMRATNISLNGKNVVVAGFGDCGSGIAKRANGMGANIIVTEVDPVRALRAFVEGYRVMTMNEAASIGDIFITATGDCDIITARHFSSMKDGVILCNAGHFNVEIDMCMLENYNSKKVRDNIVEYHLPGVNLYVLAEGRLVNLVAGDGHPIEIMDMSFAIQALTVEYLINHRQSFSPCYVYNVPEQVNRKVAEIKLRSSGITIDVLSSKQRQYLGIDTD